MGHFRVPWYKVDGVKERRQVAQQKYVQSTHVSRCRKFDWKIGDVVRVRCPREEMCWVLLLVPRAVELMNEEPECGMWEGRGYGGSWSRRLMREDGWKELS
ncbi:hypothetical protein NDU88_005226 [Pleurodeles waltl]|uniref:Uncharacterized protein n=1 Tax=Pleurodeles waltl TaxID=8319 RepID=A0AAV7W784_PLEWA|nr:hypothetical protein NDU88_005226 [Pleurodeles waltl]